MKKSISTLGRVASLTTLLLLSTCNNSLLSEPIGIGPDRDQLKQSPCACTEIPQNYAGWERS